MKLDIKYIFKDDNTAQESMSTVWELQLLVWSANLYIIFCKRKENQNASAIPLVEYFSFSKSPC